MNDLEQYLLINNNIDYKYFYNNYKQFNYDSYKELKLDLDFLLINIYSDIKKLKDQIKIHLEKN